MRNKQKFLDAADAVLKEEFKSELNVVEDAAHLMTHMKSTTYTLPSSFTKTNKNEVFEFEIKPRPRTDKPDEEIDDYFYIERGE